MSSHEGCREDSCVVATGNHLYVCGGMLDYDLITKSERFDTAENKWEEIANMQQKRRCAFGAAIEGKIFLAGGFQEMSWSKTCEMHNISTNEWQFIGSLNAVHSYGSMVCLTGTLYVLGDTSADHLNVECYDPSEDKWMNKTTIPVTMISKDNNNRFKGCVLKLSKGVLDKLDVVME